MSDRSEVGALSHLRNYKDAFMLTSPTVGFYSKSLGFDRLIQVVVSDRRDEFRKGVFSEEKLRDRKTPLPGKCIVPIHPCI